MFLMINFEGRGTVEPRSADTCINYNEQFCLSKNNYLKWILANKVKRHFPVCRGTNSHNLYHQPHFTDTVHLGTVHR